MDRRRLKIDHIDMKVFSVWVPSNGNHFHLLWSTLYLSAQYSASCSRSTLVTDDTEQMLIQYFELIP